MKKYNLVIAALLLVTVAFAVQAEESVFSKEVVSVFVKDDQRVNLRAALGLGQDNNLANRIELKKEAEYIAHVLQNAGYVLQGKEINNVSVVQCDIAIHTPTLNGVMSIGCFDSSMSHIKIDVIPPNDIFVFFQQTPDNKRFIPEMIEKVRQVFLTKQAREKQS